MSFKTIATVLHDPDSHRSALEMAISFARKMNAHLRVLCIGVDHSDPGYYYAGAQAFAVQQNFEQAQGTSNALVEIARQRLGPEDILWDVQGVTALPGGLDAVIADEMRFCDLVIAAAPYQADSTYTDTQVFESCIFGANRPMLVVPNGALTDAVFDNIMVAWDNGLPAMGAAREAIPLLAMARGAEITIIDPPIHGRDRSDPGGRLAGYLCRFGARANVAVLALSQPSIAAQLLTRAKEQGASLVVMGAYGHSPMREAILGGATRDMLKLTHLPVFMAH